MRAVIQRVKHAQVTVAGKTIGTIKSGLVVFLAVGHGDTERDAEYMADKTLHLRVFEDEEGKMNLSLLDRAGEMLVVSQFTLMADCRKGRRPSFDQAAGPQEAVRLYGYYIQRVKDAGVTVATGEFQASMEVELVNQGPVTFLLDSRKIF